MRCPPALTHDQIPKPMPRAMTDAHQLAFVQIDFTRFLHA